MLIVYYIYQIHPNFLQATTFDYYPKHLGFPEVRGGTLPKLPCGGTSCTVTTIHQNPNSNQFIRAFLDIKPLSLLNLANNELTQTVPLNGGLPKAPLFHRNYLLCSYYSI